MRVRIRNFRAIRDQTLDIAPITLIHGENGTGKSSVLYALLTFKNIVLDPNRPVDHFFGYGFLGLGNFKAVVFDHNEREPIELQVTVNGVTYTVTLTQTGGEFALRADADLLGEPVQLSLPVSFPYPANATAVYQHQDSDFQVTWNGIAAYADQLVHEQAQRLVSTLNAPAELLRGTEIVPLRRGFTKPQYSIVSISPWLVTDDEVASLLANDKYLVGLVSTNLERIAGRDLRVHVVPGTAMFSLDTVEKATGVTCELVNEGFGTNQLVFLLAKTLRKDVRLVGIEEPEIHLHPSVQRKLAQALVDIARNEDKRFLITTHSEAFVSALLAEVARKRLRPEDLACYWAVKEGKEVRFVRQQVDERGGIEGGLRAFMVGELEDLKVFLGLE